MDVLFQLKMKIVTFSTDLLLFKKSFWQPGSTRFASSEYVYSYKFWYRQYYFIQVT